ncbi:MAG: hypothetical protein ACKO37_05880 [Vampirovibrionales bacterium]
MRAFIRSALAHLGKTEDTFLAIGVGCLTSATLRPLITLHNKKEAPTDRAYAAKRECINGFVAFSCVLTFSEVFKRLGHHLFAPAFQHLPHEARLEKLRAMSILSGAVGTAVSNLAIPNIGNLLIGPVDRLFGKKSSPPLAKVPSAALNVVSTPRQANIQLLSRPTDSTLVPAIPFTPLTTTLSTSSVPSNHAHYAGTLLRHKAFGVSPNTTPWMGGTIR